MHVLEFKEGRWVSLGDAKTSQEAAKLAPEDARIVQGLRPEGIDEDAFIVVESRTGWKK